MKIKALLIALVIVLPAQVWSAPLRFTNRPQTCLVVGDTYQLAVEVTRRPMVRLLDTSGRELMSVSPWLQEGGLRRVASASPAPHLHPLRSGPYLVELHLENVVLRGGGAAWPGLAELSIVCHSDRVYVTAAFLLPDKPWVNRGPYVYPAAEGHREGATASPQSFDMDLTGPGGPSLAFCTTTPEAKLTSEQGTAAVSAAASEVPWQPGSVHEAGVMVAVGEPGRVLAALEDQASPLPASAFAMKMGTAAGYDPRTGCYGLIAQTSGTPEPPAGLRAGAHYTLTNDRRPRTVLIDQRDPWGGISGGIVRDGSGEPLPLVPQFGLNFPELHQEAGEPGWATMTYPLQLRPGETRELQAEHLYRALTDRPIMYLTSLDNIGDPLLLQTTVGQVESHTLTTGPYPGAFKPGNELRVNDFRRIHSQVRVRSVSAILPTFFGYWDAAGEYQGLMPGSVAFRETGPFLCEYTVECATRDGAVEGTLRVWQAAHADMTRIFTEVDLHATRAVKLDPGRPAALFFLRHHAFNPMAFMRYAFTGADGTPQAGKLSHARTVVENGLPLGPVPLGAIYRAENAIDQGLPCSDITGNSGFVLLDWDVQIGGRAVAPGGYAFCTGAGDEEDGAYARDVAVVPAAGKNPVVEITRGSRIRYSAVQMVWGDNSSDETVMQAERERWALHPVQLSAEVGRVASQNPPEVTAHGGRARLTLSGGTDWLALRLGGMAPGKPLRVRQTDPTGSQDLGPAVVGEPWYSAWPQGSGKCGFTLLVRMPPGGGPVQLEAWQ